MLTDTCHSCGARCYSCESLRGNLRCQAAVNRRMQLERDELHRWINEGRAEVAIQELAEAPLIDLRLKHALTGVTP
jgi:hypothetical protein